MAVPSGQGSGLHTFGGINGLAQSCIVVFHHGEETLRRALKATQKCWCSPGWSLYDACTTNLSVTLMVGPVRPVRPLPTSVPCASVRAWEREGCSLSPPPFSDMAAAACRLPRVALAKSSTFVSSTWPACESSDKVLMHIPASGDCTLQRCNWPGPPRA